MVSENLNDTGKFFGQVEGAVLESMVENEIFRNLTVYDLQGVCVENFLVSSDSRGLFTVSFEYLTTYICVFNC